jgi:hypothetical protein
MVPGGRVELPTPAFSGPRSTGELPRHRGDKHSTGAAGNSQNAAVFSRRRTHAALAAVRFQNFRRPGLQPRRTRAAMTGSFSPRKIRWPSGRPERSREAGRKAGPTETLRHRGRLDALAAVGLEFANPVFAFQDFARLCAFGGTDDAVFFHHVDQPRRATVADAQAALQS